MIYRKKSTELSIKYFLRFAFAIFVITFQFFSNQNCFAQEVSQEVMSLKEIDKLLEDTDYSKALIELSKYADKYPEQRDSVQKRIDKVMNSRNQYIILANNLIDVMEKEPENDQKKLEIIAALESVEKNPTEEQLSFIKQAKIAAQFTYYRSRFKRISDEASDLANNKQYAESVNKIRDGFGMYRQEFYDENPKSVTDSATEIINRITSSCKTYESSQNRLNNAYLAFIKAVNSGSYKDSINAYTSFESEMTRLATLREQLYSDAKKLESAFVSLKKKNPQLTEASYLPFIYKFTLGLENSTSGIIGTIDTQYKNYIEGAKPVIYSTITTINVEKIDRTNIDVIKQSDLPTTKLSNTDNFCNLAITVNNLYSKIPHEYKYQNQFPNYVQSMNYAKTIVSTLSQSYNILKEYQSLNDVIENIKQPGNALEGIRAKNSYAQVMIDCFNKYQNCSDSANLLLNQNWFVSYSTEINQNKKTEFLKYDNLQDYYSLLNKTLAEVAKEKSQIQLALTATYFAGAINEIIENYQTQYKNADDLLLDHYPQEARSLIAQTNKSLDSDKQILISCRDILLNATKGTSVLTKESREVISSIDTMDKLKSQSDSTVASCNQEILLSERALNEAELRYNQAVSAYKRNDYTQARKNIELASTKYKESLDHQESQVVRTEADKKLLALGQEINDAENKLIVAEVRKLKNQAKTAYYNGDFEKAENYLAQAKSRWSVTNGNEEDEEIKNLLALVETALSMKTGRVIPPTAPLFPEMSQLLSIAHQYYNQGSKQIKKNEREKGIETLSQAKKKLQEVQLVYPLNQEASLLTLKIDQLIDPSNFNEMFVQKVNAAKENYKVAGKQQTAYTDLLDLYEIRPDYPGLKNLIQQVEIEIGVRQKPVDNSSIVRSQSLTREAQQIVNGAGSNENQLKNALAKLDQAIALNPNNNQAILLKDRVQISLGGRASIVLSSSDEAKYQQAIQCLQRNNTLDAYTLVQQLLQNPANRRSTKVLDLEKKVKALL